MEILKFDESGSSSPSRKRSGRGAILVAFVAVVFGASTALASGTLTINNPQNTIALDQGVANSVQCDDAIGVTLIAPYDTSEEDFVLSGVTVSGIDITDSTIHCLNKDFTIKIYDDLGIQKEFCVPYSSGSSPSGDVGCAENGKSQTLQATASTNGTLEFSQGAKLLTGEPDPSWSPSPDPNPTNTPQPRVVNVKNVTVESSDHPETA